MRDARVPPIDRISEAYLDQARGLTYPELRARQAPPLACLAHGAAGLAYFFWRVAAVRGDASFLDDAERWLDAAALALSEASRDDGERSPPWEHSMLQGPDGVLFARILVAHAREARDEGSTRAFQSRCGDLDRAPCDLFAGAAGYLAAARVLREQTGDDRFSAAADDVASALVRRCSTWSGMTNLAFAHGRAGVLHALLRWERACEVTPRSRGSHAQVTALMPAWLEGLVSDEGAAPRSARSPRPRAWAKRSWCAGAAGSALLWAEAYSWERNPKYLERARESGHALLSDVRLRAANLCCGHAGRSYGLLAVDRIDPGQGWRDAAVDAAVRAADCGGAWPNSVLQGYPGLALLTWDLRERRPRGFPIVEA